MVCSWFVAEIIYLWMTRLCSYERCSVCTDELFHEKS